ncbi:MAG: hypothetical protein IT495_04460 [Gammaproteobacteria bacterium]|nr:hypothetical protein [Gammaproteobacteria bacterium]
MALNHLQHHLERIYEVELAHRVEDFLTSDPRLLAAMQPGEREARERLLVCEDEQGLSMSLYLDQAVLAALDPHDPLAPAHAAAVDAWCLALEGVSHFLYLGWRAVHDRSVSLLELELQAEVDKYAALLCVLTARGSGQAPGALHAVLFEAVRFDPALSAVEQRRYRNANQYAAQYCARLDADYVRCRDYAGLMRALRRFYRLDQAGKLRHIERL